MLTPGCPPSPGKVRKLWMGQGRARTRTEGDPLHSHIPGFSNTFFILDGVLRQRLDLKSC